MATEYFQSALFANEMDAAWLNNVRYDKEQDLSETQKAQARNNIGAVAFGSLLKILGHYDTIEALQSNGEQKAGNAYSVGTAVPYKLYVFDGLSESWMDYGYIRSQDISSRSIQNVVISTSAWVQDTAVLAGYSYKAQIALADSTAECFPIVVFESEQAFSGNFAPVSFAVAGYVEIFVKEIPTKDINILSVTVIVNGGVGKGITNASAGIAAGSIKTANLADGSVTAVKIADRAISVVKSVQLPTTGWTRNSDGVYEANVTVSGLKTTDTVVLGLRRGTVNPDGWTMTLAAFDSDQETFSKILAGRITAANTLHLYAKETITNAIYLNCWVVSK